MEPVETIVLYKLYKQAAVTPHNLESAGIGIDVNEAITFMTQLDTQVQETMNNVMLKRKRYKYKQVNGKTKRILV